MRSSFSKTPLRIATPRDVVKMLLGTLCLSFLISAVGPMWLAGERPLHSAASLGSASLVRVFVEIYDVDTKTRSGHTALYLAARGGHAEVARVLVEAGADVNIPQRRGLTPLHTAVLNGHAEVARVLVEAGADVNARTEAGSTALGVVQRRNYQEIVKLLEEAGAHFAVNTGDAARLVPSFAALAATASRPWAHRFLRDTPSVFSPNAA